MNEKISNVANIIKSVFSSALTAADIAELNEPVNANVVRWYMIEGMFGDAPMFLMGNTKEVELLCRAACLSPSVNPVVTQIGFHCRIKDGYLEQLGYTYDDVWHLAVHDTKASPFSGNVVDVSCRERKQLVCLAMNLAKYRQEYEVQISKHARIRFIFRGHDIKSFQEVPYSNMQESEWL